MLRRLVLHLAWLVPIVTVGFPVAAQQRSLDWTRCTHEWKTFSLDAQISGCTAIAGSGDETTASRAKAYHSRAIAHWDKGDTERAIADYTEAIKLNSSDAIVYYNRAIALGAKGDAGSAIADYTEAMS